MWPTIVRGHFQLNFFCSAGKKIPLDTFFFFASLIVLLVKSVQVCPQFLEALEYLVVIKAGGLHDDSKPKYIFSQWALESFFSHGLVSAKDCNHLGRYHFRKHIH